MKFFDFLTKKTKESAEELARVHELHLALERMKQTPDFKLVFEIALTAKKQTICEFIVGAVAQKNTGDVETYLKILEELTAIDRYLGDIEVYGKEAINLMERK